MHWLYHFFGLDNLSGSYYGFWSGVGSDISEVAIFGALAAHARAFNCQIHGCWRLGHRTTAAGHRVCRRHAKPLGKLTADDMLAAHTEALADSSTQGAATDGV